MLLHIFVQAERRGSRDGAAWGHEGTHACGTEGAKDCQPSRSTNLRLCCKHVRYRPLLSWRTSCRSWPHKRRYPMRLCRKHMRSRCLRDECVRITFGCQSPLDRTGYTGNTTAPGHGFGAPCRAACWHYSTPAALHDLRSRCSGLRAPRLAPLAATPCRSSPTGPRVPSTAAGGIDEVPHPSGIPSSNPASCQSRGRCPGSGVVRTEGPQVQIVAHLALLH
mmetsp:Transcript_140995/g.351620  ORF Transcript_140995/g.351620 Transcript_140995/m.351620 type:complete len:221 (-) Transcript_140995:136-798(-)